MELFGIGVGVHIYTDQAVKKFEVTEGRATELTVGGNLINAGRCS